MSAEWLLVEGEGVGGTPTGVKEVRRSPSPKDDDVEDDLEHIQGHGQEDVIVAGGEEKDSEEGIDETAEDAVAQLQKQLGDQEKLLAQKDVAFTRCRAELVEKDLIIAQQRQQLDNRTSLAGVKEQDRVRGGGAGQRQNVSADASSHPFQGLGPLAKGDIVIQLLFDHLERSTAENAVATKIGGLPTWASLVLERSAGGVKYVRVKFAANEDAPSKDWQAVYVLSMTLVANGIHRHCTKTTAPLRICGNDKYPYQTDLLPGRKMVNPGRYVRNDKVTLVVHIELLRFRAGPLQVADVRAVIADAKESVGSDGVALLVGGRSFELKQPECLRFCTNVDYSHGQKEARLDGGVVMDGGELEAIVKYLNGAVTSTINDDSVCMLLSAASALGALPILDLCEEFLVWGATRRSTSRLLLLADEHNLAVLRYKLVGQLRADSTGDSLAKVLDSEDFLDYSAALAGRLHRLRLQVEADRAGRPLLLLRHFVHAGLTRLSALI